jgi:hypothetical protein
MSFPALDLATFSTRTTIPTGDVAVVEGNQPGYVNQRIVTQTGWLYNRLRKRYAKTIPFGQTAPSLLAWGISPPAVTLIGRPVLGSILVRIQVTTPGPLGTAVVMYTINGGSTWTTSVTTAPTVLLGTSGMSAVFPVGTYDTSNQYAAATPVPESFLDWLTVLVSNDVMWKRGTNPQDPAIVALTERRKQVLDEVKEAADSKDGLFDLPISDDEQSAISSGGPMGTSNASPYAWTTQTGNAGRAQDAGRWRGSR